MTPPGQTPGADDPLLKDLRELQSFAAQFQNVIATARQAAPLQASGQDSTGVVAAQVDSEGGPTSLVIAQGWQHRLKPEQLGPAVTESYQTAIQRHLEQWGSDLQRDGWQYDARDLDDRVATAPPVETPEFSFPAPVGEPRPIDSMLGDLITELDFAHDLANQPAAPPTADTPAAHAKVRVSITNGQLESVHIDAEWATGKDASVINGELASALQTARLSQPQTPNRLPHADRLDDLLGDVMNFLSHHRSEK